jgi:hypothetical protein
MAEKSGDIPVPGRAEERRPMIRSLGEMQTGKSVGESVSRASGRELTMASISHESTFLQNLGTGTRGFF